MPPGSSFNPQQALNDAVGHHGAGRLAEAEALYRQVLEVQPDHPDALHLLGVLADQSGNPDLAEDLITKALAARPDFADALSNLGNVLRKLGRPDDALQSLQKALDLEPANPMTHNSLGNTLMEMDKPEDAADSFRKALDLQPQFPLALNNLGTALAKLEQLDDAEKNFKEALTMQPDYAEAHTNLGNVLHARGRLEEAVGCHTKALSLNPEYVEAHGNLGIIFQKMERIEDAVSCHKRALALNPDYIDSLNCLGLMQQDLGQLDEAAANHQRAIALDPDSSESHNNLGIAYQKLGRLKEAVNYFQKALVLDPDNIVAWGNLKYMTRALLFSHSEDDIPDGLNDIARANVGYALQKFYLNRFKPHEADESFDKLIAALPPISEEAIPIDGAPGKPDGPGRLPDKLVALLHFGRSGTGLLHSLIDGHPEISTLPGIYLRGYFNQGVWDYISADGWKGLPDRFIETFEVLFDAETTKPIPSRLGEEAFSIGKSEGMTTVGENRDEVLTVDRDAFRAEALRLMESLNTIDPISFLIIVHAAFEKAIGTATEKHTIFYHIHNPNDYAKSNFLRHASNARLLMMVREPIQSCESWIRVLFRDNKYDKTVSQLLTMLFDIDQIAFRRHDAVGIRMEDLKARPEATLQALCTWMGVEDSPCLYEMTAQGKKWWGDPSSLDYDDKKAMSPFDKAATKRPVGSIFSDQDQFVLGTLYYPFSVRFGYREPDPAQFKKDLEAIRPLIGGMLDFEKAMAEKSNADMVQFKQNGAFQLFRSGLLERWKVLDELGDYPHMLKPLAIE